MSLLAQEIRGRLEAAGFPVDVMRLYDTGEHEGALTEFAGEAMVVTAPDEDIADETDLAFVCGEDDPRSALYLDWVGRGRGVAVDLVGATRRRAEVPVVNCDVNPEAIRPGGRLVAAPHPLAHPLGTLLHRVRIAFPLREASATILRPVSDHGEAGIQELQRQTVELLSFREIPKETFGRQVAFNIVPLAVLGEADLEARAADDVRRVLAAPGLPLALRVLQAPTFYGHGYSLHVLVEGAPSAGEVASALELPGVVSISGEDGPRTPVDLADEAGIWVAGVTPDPGRPGGFWIWAVTDAVRSGAAANAARIASRLVEVAA
jgi:aspartate-semialdehyde dehydrogenase